MPLVRDRKCLQCGKLGHYKSKCRSFADYRSNSTISHGGCQKPVHTPPRMGTHQSSGAHYIVDDNDSEDVELLLKSQSIVFMTETLYPWTLQVFR